MKWSRLEQIVATSTLTGLWCSTVLGVYVFGEMHQLWGFLVAISLPVAGGMFIACRRECRKTNPVLDVLATQPADERIKKGHPADDL